ncbi:MAG TPA: hypothetical protein VJ827_11015 [Rubrobacter sp.]|nr:hypothetical protein [Rubrobacter sp.]
MSNDRLYDLLPAIHRVRDAEGRAEGVEGNLPLRSLLSIIATEIDVVEEELAQLYDDQFIETCAEWVVPYIGDLVGVGGLHDLKQAASRRAQVANTVAYRRRKGTAAILEGLARDATGWPAHAVEFFRYLATTQHVNHVRLSNLYSPDLRNWEPLEYVGTPFDEIPHTADVRHIASGRGLHNIPNVGIFLWRLPAYPLTLSPAVQLDDNRFLFDPLGKDTQLFTNPEPETDIARLSKPINVPMPISRRVLREYLESYYGPEKGISLVGVFKETNGDDHRVEDYGPELVSSCNLDDREDGDWAHEPEHGISIDPVLGRIFFDVEPPQGFSLARLLVTYHYAFSADMGGGEYDRASSIRTESQRIERVAMPEIRTAIQQLDRIDEAAFTAAEETHPGIQEALTDLGGEGGVVEVLDSGRHEVLSPKIEVGRSQSLGLQAADGHRPTIVLRGELEIEGGADAEVTLNGLLIAGGALRISGELRRVRLEHCTLVPGIRLKPDGEPDQGPEPSLRVEAENAEVEIDRCILGGMRIEAGSEARITDSIIDATDTANVAYAARNGPGGRLNIRNSTVIGTVNTDVLELGSNTIFLGRVEARRKQEGCVRFSFLPLGSEVPRRHRCRPENQAEAGRIRPQFSSLRYGDPGYCQLTRLCAEEIRRGADDESEMGAFHDLYAPQREANLRARLEEYLRFGLEAGILYAT